MKRYVIFTSLVCLILSALTKYQNIFIYLITFILSVLAGGFFVVRKKISSFVLISLSLISFFCFLSIKEIKQIEKIKNSESDNVYLSAVVVSDEQKTENSDFKKCIIKVLDNKNGIFRKGDKLQLSFKEDINYNIGKRIDGAFQIEALDKSYAKNSFYADGIYARVKSKYIRVSDSGIFIYEFTEKVRKYIKSVLFSKIYNADLCVGMLYGEMGYISPDFINDVRRCGVSHVLVVSGMHFVIICGGFSRLLNIFRTNKLVKDIITAFFVFALMCVCLFTVSVIRAGIACFVIIAFHNLKRNSNSFISLCDALIVILFISPFAYHSISFKLSFASASGIIAIYPLLSKSIYKKFKDSTFLRWLLNSIALSLSASVFTFPVVVKNFGYFSLISLLVNVFVGFSVTFILYFALMGIVLNLISLDIYARIFFFLTDVMADYFKAVVSLFSSIPFACIYFKRTGLMTVLVLLFYFLIYKLCTCKNKGYLVKLKRIYLKKEKA